jgi:hypothetical protein
LPTAVQATIPSMPLTLFSPQARANYLLALPWPERMLVFRLWGYRVGVYAVINLLDDPAWLALMFC